MKKLTFNNGIKNYALFGILGLVLNTRFCAHQNLNVKSLKNDLTHKAIAHLNHVSDQVGISSPGLLRCHFLGEMFRLRPFCVHRSFNTKSFSLGQFIWGVEGALKQYHWTSSLSFDLILHKSIFRLSVQANPLKKSFSNRTFLGAARMIDSSSDANFNDPPKMIDLVSTAADFSEVSREERIRLQENCQQKILRQLKELMKVIEPIMETSGRHSSELSRIFEKVTQGDLALELTSEVQETCDTLTQKCKESEAVFDEFTANTIKEYNAKIYAIIESLKTRIEKLEPSQDDDLLKMIEGFIKNLKKDYLADHAVHERPLLKILDWLRNFSKGVCEPFAYIVDIVNKRLEVREDKKIEERDKEIEALSYKLANLQKENIELSLFLEEFYKETGRIY